MRPRVKDIPKVDRKLCFHKVFERKTQDEDEWTVAQFFSYISIDR